MNMTRHRTPPALAAVALIVAACGGSDAADVAAGENPPATTTSAPAEPLDDQSSSTTTEVGESSTSTEPPDSTSTTTLPPDCPAPPQGTGERPEPPGPVEPDATVLAESGAMSGRYRFEDLGVAIAFDAPSPYAFANLVSDRRVQLGAAPLGYIAIVRPDTGIDFGAWLADVGDTIEIVEDVEFDLDGRAARSVTYVPAAGFPPADFVLGEYVYNSDGDQPNRIVRIEVGAGLQALYLVFDSFAEGADYVTQTAPWLETFRIGDAVPMFIPDVPAWDTATAEVEVPGPCRITSSALDGVKFELAAASEVIGLGDQLVIRDGAGTHTGVHPPLISVTRPESAWVTLGDWDDERELGAPIRSVDEVVAQLETQGWEITGRSAGEPMLGTGTVVIEAIGPVTPSWLWLPGSTFARPAEEFAIDPFRVVEFVVAESARGLVVASLEWEQDTTDGDILRERFTKLVATIAPF